MGFLTPTPPPFDLEEWGRKSHLAKIKPLAQDWAINGVGSPTAVYLLYIVKLVVFSLGALLVISTTDGLGSPSNFSEWWTEPIVWQKLAVWVLLWEFVGLGCGSMPLTFRFLPPIGSITYWLRPGTIRQPPWPGKVPLTAGSTRSVFDVGLAVGVIASAIYLLASSGEAVAGLAAGRLDPAEIAVLLGFLIVLGLRDKVSFLSARIEVYGFLLVLFMFPIENLIVGSQLILLCIWWGAASSKLNRHFPFVVATMISNTPWNRSRTVKRHLYKDYPDDIRPGFHAMMAAHTGTVMEFALPLALVLSNGGTVTTIAVIGMLIFHLHITSTFPLAVPLEWNLFMMYGIVYLFAENASVPFSTLDPAAIAAIVAIGVLIPIYGNFRPRHVSFLPSMRYYAGNWATSQWMFRNDGAEEKLDQGVVKSAPIVIKQLDRLYGRELGELLLYKGLAFRSLHSHGRALNALTARAVDDVENYTVREGELLAGVVTGWNFGDGHFHNDQLLEAIQERVGYEEGELRVVMIESQPAHVQRQHYRIYDAKVGLIEEGYVQVADMVSRSPWLDENPSEFPVEVIGNRTAALASTPGGMG